MGSAVKLYLNLRFFFEREQIIRGKLKPFFYNLKNYIIDNHVIMRNVSRKQLFRKTHHYLQSDSFQVEIRLFIILRQKPKCMFSHLLTLNTNLR